MRATVFTILLALQILITSPIYALTPQDGCGADKINTAIGCISTDMTTGGFVGSLTTFLIGLGGGIALILMLVGVFLITTSNGIPDKIKAGNEIITSAVIGLTFMIMSLILLKLIGIDLLGIPGLY